MSYIILVYATNLVSILVLIRKSVHKLRLDKVRRYFTVFALKFREWLHKALKRDFSLPRL